jgi:uridine kinase
MNAREDLLDRLARHVPAPGRRVLVAIDGPDGAGKTGFAADLSAALERIGRPVVVIHVDDFLNPRAVRHRLGRDSPDGFFRDSVDLHALDRLVLRPLGASGDGRFRRRAFDHPADKPVDAPVEFAPPEAVVIVEGLFLHRDELAGRWDWSVFLDVPFTVTAKRMSQRDGTHPDPSHPSMRRYVEGRRRYFAECSPWSRATHMIEHADPARPNLVGSCVAC